MELSTAENRKPNGKVERTLAIRTIWVLIPATEGTGFLMLGSTLSLTVYNMWTLKVSTSQVILSEIMYIKYLAQLLVYVWH